VLDRELVDPAGVEHGAYVLWDGGNPTPRPDIVLLATGSEVSVALDAAGPLAASGVAVRVVSMPCWELFEAQSQAYRDQVLPPNARARLSVEAGVALGWRRWLGPHGASISIERFGASAPGKTVLERFGFSADRVASRARALLERSPSP
jgi:transketolase